MTHTPTIRRLHWLLLVVATLAVSCIRFNRMDWGISQYTGSVEASDAAEYVALVDLYRGDVLTRMPSAPFSYRILVPYLASLLPFGAMTSLNLINVASTLGALGALRRLLGWLALGERLALIIPLLFVVSFPVFYYGAIGYLEPVGVMLVTVALWATVRQRFWVVLLLVCLGAAVKEATVVCLPAYVVYTLRQGQARPRAVLETLALISGYLLVTVMCRWLSVDSSQYMWAPSAHYWHENLVRPRAYVSALLVLGVPAFICALLLFRDRARLFRGRLEPLEWACLAGAAACTGLYVLAFLSAYADGRPLWFSVPYLLVWSAAMLKRPALADLSSGIHTDRGEHRSGA